ncbi:MAG: 3-isopropylmalate dehydratase small subunit [Euryarchaeota archaeon]|nr:3-isopropylmalate dehydratase small subunit [Euryarchaeota archaeon]
MNILRGRAHRFGNDVNTDYIISGKYKFKTLDINEMAKHVMEDLRPKFCELIEDGDFIVAGRNFGCGSSREQAPLVLQAAGVGAVIAESFARVFYRNCINVGLPVVECDTSGIEEGDELQVDLRKGLVHVVSKGKIVKATPLPAVMVRILDDGGLVEHFRKHGGFKFSDEG